MNRLRKTKCHQFISLTFRLMIVNQLLQIVYNLYSACDAYPTLETRCVFLNMPKVFDKVCHQWTNIQTQFNYSFRFPVKSY